MISTIPFDSNQPNELKSSLCPFKNLAKLSKSTFKVSDQNTPPSKLIQKSIFRHYPTISTMSFHSKSSKESKSTLGSFKNLVKLSKSTKNNSNQNTPPSKLVQKSIFKLPSCSSYSPHQNPIKIMPKIIQKPIQKVKFSFGHVC